MGYVTNSISTLDRSPKESHSSYSLNVPITSSQQTQNRFSHIKNQDCAPSTTLFEKIAKIFTIFTLLFTIIHLINNIQNVKILAEAKSLSNGVIPNSPFKQNNPVTQYFKLPHNSLTYQCPNYDKYYVSNIYYRNNTIDHSIWNEKLKEINLKAKQKECSFKQRVEYSLKSEQYKELYKIDKDPFSIVDLDGWCSFAQLQEALGGPTAYKNLPEINAQDIVTDWQGYPDIKPSAMMDEDPIKKGVSASGHSIIAYKYKDLIDGDIYISLFFQRYEDYNGKLEASQWWHVGSPYGRDREPSKTNLERIVLLFNGGIVSKRYQLTCEPATL
jgi:hypothetical protein